MAKLCLEANWRLPGKWSILSIMVVLSMIQNSCIGQKFDYTWLSGYNSADGFDPHSGLTYGITKLDFNPSAVTTSLDSLGMNLDVTNVCMSSADGQLLFYSNGIFAANFLDEKIEGSDSLNGGWLTYVLYPQMQTEGYRATQGMLCLPFPSQKDKYYLLHSYVDTLNDVSEIVGREIRYTVIDMAENNGHGKVIIKNVPIVNDALGWEISATKHGNGRDWWLLAQKRNTNCYYRILIDPLGVHLMPDLTCGGLPTAIGNVGACCFSPSGDNYVYLNGSIGLSVFNFDRCEGMLSNPKTWSIPNPGWGSFGTAISNNDRYLYASMTGLLFQFDLTANDLSLGLDTIALYDGVLAPFPTYFSLAQLGPDGKIYISCGNADTVFHVVSRPDEKGDSCLFKPHFFRLKSVGNTIPNLPNYRLYNKTGSHCDTLEVKIDEEIIPSLKVYPNPVSDFVRIDYGNISLSGAPTIEIYNSLGQLISHVSIPPFSGFQDLDVKRYPEGPYYINLLHNSVKVAAGIFFKH